MQYSASNLAVLKGTVTNDPSARELVGGTLVVSFDVATTTAGDRERAAAPVAWHDPSPSGREAVVAGADVVVVGTIRRRFFRSGGATQSRTEVVADRVVPATRVKTVASMLAAVAAELAP